MIDKIAAEFPGIPYLQMIDELIAHFQKYDSPVLYEAAIEAVEFCRITGRLEKAVEYAKLTGDKNLVKGLEAEFEASKQEEMPGLSARLRWK